jgi:hypothetical protein
MPRVPGQARLGSAGKSARVTPTAAETPASGAGLAVLYESTVRTPIAPMHGKPRIASQMVSQQIAGHRVEIVDEEGDWLRARGRDNYEGWMHTGFLVRTPHAPDTTAPPGTAPVRVSLGCTTRTAGGGRRSLPLRAILAADEVVTSGNVIEMDALERRFPLRADAIVQSAQEFFSATSYLWGGVTPWGADCSGLAQSVFSLHGLQLPRDAWQQAETGSDAGRDVGELRIADLLFFSDRFDRRVTHVGIALGERRMVHLALGRGGYAIEQLDDRRDPFVERLRERFLFARRLL